MDRSAAPWRVLDDTNPSDGTGFAPPGSERPVDPGGASRWSWTLVGGLGLAAALAIGAFAIAATSPSGEIVIEGGLAVEPSPSTDGGVAPASTHPRLVVDVQGAVLEPGVRALDPGSRVGDAIAAAGGYGPRVDAERAGRELNLAEAVTDGDRIVVPSRDDPPSSPAGGTGTGSAGDGGTGGGGLVDINTATAAELDELPGVGPVTAQKIIDARAEAPFSSVDDLLDRKVVGASVFEKLRDLIAVR